MKINAISNLSNRELLQQHSSIIEELVNRNVLRTRNNPVADYAEWLVANKLCLTLQTNSKAGYDAVDSSGVTYQIKARRERTQLGVIRNLNQNAFDYLIVVIFHNDFSVKEAYNIPHSIIVNYANHSSHQNGHILCIRRNGIINDSQTQNITQLFQ